MLIVTQVFRFNLTLLSLLLTLSFVRAGEPVILGSGEGRFEIGKLLESDDFKNLDNWEVQVEAREGLPEAKISAKGSLDCLVPNRGATIWFKKKLKTRVTITYDVVCPVPVPAIDGVSPRDINNFWMASAPNGGDLFDYSQFTGAFPSYHKLHGYYASTGGGSKAKSNRTTRMRRYPREEKGKHKNHLFLNHRDEKEDYLIKPDQTMAIQLVAYDDLVQYIVDGELVYELKEAQLTQMETTRSSGKVLNAPARYFLKHFPPYEEGYFGFRMVGTHHIYRNFRVHALKKPEPKKVAVSSIDELRNAVKGSNQRITMKPGKYLLKKIKRNSNSLLHFSGSHNEIILTGVTIETPLRAIRRMRSSRDAEAAVFHISGDKVTLTGGTFEDIYPDGKTKITDFGSYNQRSEYHPRTGTVDFLLTGDDITMKGSKLTVRGSTPYGYGNMYGIGGGAVVRLRKHSGILTKGDRPIIDGCHLKMESFGHGIFFQGGDDILVQNCIVEGKLRRSEDLYKEQSKEDLPRKFNYQLQWPESIRGLPIPKDHMINLSEDGIRAYPGTRHVVVKNCKVMRMRAGVKLYLGRSGTIEDCEVTDCIVQGYSLPSKGKMIRCSGNAAYGPLLYIHSDSHNSQDIDLTVLPAPHSIGDHPLAAINGTRNTIHFTSASGKSSDIQRPIIVGYPMRFDFLSINYPEVPAGYEKNFAEYSSDSYRASRNTIINKTNNPVVLGKLATNNDIESTGKVTDYGSDN